MDYEYEDDKVNVGKYAGYLMGVIVFGAIGLVSINTYYSHKNAEIREARQLELKQRQEFSNVLYKKQLAEQETQKAMFEEANKKADIERLKQIDKELQLTDKQRAIEKEKEKALIEKAKQDWLNGGAERARLEREADKKMLYKYAEDVQNQMKAIEQEKQRNRRTK